MMENGKITKFFEKRFELKESKILFWLTSSWLKTFFWRKQQKRGKFGPSSPISVVGSSWPVWPDDAIKSYPIFHDIAQKVAKYFLHESCII